MPKIKGKSITINDLTDKPKIQPSIDFKGDYVIVGFTALDEDTRKPQRLILMSDGKNIKSLVNPQTITIDEIEYIVDPDVSLVDIGERWSVKNAIRICKNFHPPQIPFARLCKFISKYIDLPRSAIKFLAAWVMASKMRC